MASEVSTEIKDADFEEAVNLLDGLKNLVSGLGSEKDVSEHNVWTFSNRNADYRQLMNRFREDWVAQKVCTIIPQDMTRKWRHINTEEGRLADKKFRIRKLFKEAYQWARLYGTSFILLDIKKSGGLDTELRFNNLRKDCIKSMRVIDRSRIWPSGEIVLDPLSPHYGMPEYYTLAGYEGRIHHTRIVRFEGTELPLFEFQRNMWYSDSVLIPLIKTIDQFYTTAAAAANLAQEATVDVVSVAGLQSLLTSPEGEAAVLQRFKLMKLAKSIYNVLILDDTEKYDTKSIALSGVKDLIWEYLKIVAAAVGIPATRFLSASPDGMNATGESDLVNYIDLLTGLQTSVFEPRLDIVDKLLQAHFGISEYTHEWCDIFPESNIDKSKRAKDVAIALDLLVNNGTITAKAANSIVEHSKIFGDCEIGEHNPNPPNIKVDKSDQKSKQTSASVR